MSRPEQIIRLDPENELKFKGPYNVPVTSYMTLTNPSDKRVVFKIKTTAPKKYCVRPNSGILEPHKSIEIAICLQPLLYDQSDKNKHKFMVQTVIAPDGEFCVDTLWKDISPDKLMDSKLKCVFDMELLQQNAASAPTEVAPSAKEIKDEIEKEITKSSPKLSTSPAQIQAANTTSGNVDAELQKAANDIKQLREEESNLRQENLQLKEEILRLKLSAGPNVKYEQASSTKYQPVAQAPTMSVTQIAILIAMALCGIVLGKFIL